jgi:hypothetical protein
MNIMPRNLISNIVVGFGYALAIELISHLVLFIFSFLLAPNFPEYIGAYPFLSPLLSINYKLWGTLILQILIYVIWIWFSYSLGKASTGIEGLKSDTYYIGILTPILIALFAFIIDNTMLKLSTTTLIYNILNIIRAYLSVAVLSGLITSITIFFINLVKKT